MSDVAYRQKLDYLMKALGPGCVSIPRAARFIGIDEDRLRADPKLKAMQIGSRARVSLDELAKYMLAKEAER